jgi:ribonuclease HI
MDIVVFTDGSSIKGKYAGIGINFPNNELNDISLPFLISPLTNQRAELYAIYYALCKIVNDSKFINFNKITVYTDSMYSIKSVTEWIYNWEQNGWKTANKKPVKNLDIIKPIYGLLKKHPNKIFFKHVRSHTGKNDWESINNEKADMLANIGSSKKLHIH